MNKIPIGVATCLLLVGGDLLGQVGQGQRRGRRGMNVARMLQRFDANKDGKLAADEVTNERMWQRLVSADKDKDGFVTKKEMESLSAGAGRRDGRRGGGEAAWKFLQGKYDANKDGSVSSDEYDRDAATFKRLDRNGDGSLTAADWSDEGGRRTRGDAARRGTGQSGRGRGAVPEAGDKAPDFELTFVADAKKKIRLSSFVGDKPVALIFGSCT